MLKNLILANQIRKFYKIFGEVLNRAPFTVRLRDIKDYNFLLDVQFDVNEILTEQACSFNEAVYAMDVWVGKLNNSIENAKHKSYAQLITEED